MLERRVTVINELGLHARAAAQVVKKAREFSSRILLKHEVTGFTANAKSILSLLYLAAATGVSLVISAEGPDEDAALEAIVALFENGFGEL